MTNCNSYDDAYKKLQEDNDRLRQELSTSEAARKAGEAFLRTEVKKQWVFKMQDGSVRSLTDADIDRAYSDFANRLESKELDQMIERGVGNRSKPVGSNGRFVNYRMLIDTANISDAEDWLRLTEALVGTWKQMAPEDFRLVTEVWGRDRLMETVANAYKDYIDADAIATSLANNTAGFMNLAEKMTRLRFVSDMAKEGYLSTLDQIHQFMGSTSSKVPDGLKQRAWSSYKTALMAERHVAAAKRNTGQALRSLQTDFDRPEMFMPDMAEAAQTLGAKAADVKPDEHFAKVIQAIDNGDAEAIKQLRIAAVLDSIDPNVTLGKGWANTHMRFGNALVKDAQLTNLGSQVRANLMGTWLANTHGFAHQAFENIGNLTPNGTRFSREAFGEGLRVAWESAKYSHDGVRRAWRELAADSFFRGDAPFGGNLDTYGPRASSNDQLLAKVQATLEQPWYPGGPLRPINWAMLVHKQQAAVRMLAFHWTGRHEVLTPALRAMSATDSVLGYDAFLFKLKNDLEIKARRDGVQLGLLDQRSREEWVEKQLDNAFYQLAPTEENVLAFRRQHKLKGSDISDDEIRSIITADRARNTYGHPTLDTPEAQAAMDYSLANRMQSVPEPGTLAGQVDESVMAARKHWAIESLVPYWRAPFVNHLFDTRLSFGPLAETVQVLFGPNPTKEQISKVQAGWVMTGGLFTLFAGLDMAGLIEGNGPIEPNARRAWLLEGRKPNSIAGIPYLGGLPVLNTLFLWKDIKETLITGGYSNFDQHKAWWMTAQLLTTNLIRQTGFGQFLRIVDALMDPEAGMARVAGWLAQGQMAFSGPMRDLQRITGYGPADLYQSRDPLAEENYYLGDDSFEAKALKTLRAIAYGTIPLLGLPGGAPRKEQDFLGQPIQLEFGADWKEALKSRFHPRMWPRANQRVYAELDAQGQLRLPLPLLTRRLEGVAMSAELQKEYNDTFGTVKGSIPLEARAELAGRKVNVTFSFKKEIPIDLRNQFAGSGVVVTKAGDSATIDLGPFLSKHVKGKTIVEAFTSLFNDPVYQRMQDQPGTTSDLEVRDMPPSQRRQQAASRMIQGIYDYYQWMTIDQLEDSSTPDAQDWRQKRTAIAEQQFTQQTNRLQDLMEALGQPALR
jgi:hypothetical protein